MAKSQGITLIAGGVAAFVLLRMAIDNQLGTGAKTVADDIWTAFGGHALDFVSGQPTGSPSGNRMASTSSVTTSSQPVSTTSGQRYVNLGDTDLGHVPLVYDTQRKIIMQSPSWVSANASSYSPNTYGPNDVFLDASGNTISYDQALSQAGIQSA